jgi:hypothetical protein
MPQELDPSLYADLVRMGSLSGALQRVFGELSVNLSVVEVDGVIGPGWAFIHEGPRHSQVVILNDRNFHVDFWYQGVQYASGGISDLTEIARAAVAFHRERASISEIASRFVWLKPDKHVVSHERGANVFVTESWLDLERWLVLEPPPHLDGLLPLVLEAAKRPELRRLLPFTSMNCLCFSRTTGYPYSSDCPLAWRVDGGLFRVGSADEQTVLGEGDATRAADILAANLPPDCGPAIHGTREDLTGASLF